MDDITRKVEKYIQHQEYTKAIEVLTTEIGQNKDVAELYVLRGDVYHVKQEFSKALNDYRKVLKLKPDNKIISSKIEMIKEILKFEALDIYSSTNLNKDPWLDD